MSPGPEELCAPSCFFFSESLPACLPLTPSHILKPLTSFLAALGANLLKNICQVMHVLAVNHIPVLKVH